MYKIKKESKNTSVEDPPDWNIFTDMETGKGMTEPFIWCFHCERAFHRVNAKVINGLLFCAYKDCDGNLIDFKEWSSLRDYQPDLPNEPEIGKIYPLYPK